MGNNNTIQIHPVNTFNSDKRFALGVIDVQNDFCSGGSLAVTDADSTIAPINKLRFMYFDQMPTFLSQDYHCRDHMSFASRHTAKVHDTLKLNLEMEDGTMQEFNQVVWPDHCVENTNGVQFHKDLIVTKIDKIIRKGTKRNVESYSAFGDEFKGKYEKTELEEWLKIKNITDIILTGIATDYCVYNTALDAVRLGFNVHLIKSCTRGVAPNTTGNAMDDMAIKGVLFYSNVDDFYNYWKNDIIYSNHKRI